VIVIGNSSAVFVVRFVMVLMLILICFFISLYVANDVVSDSAIYGGWLYLVVRMMIVTVLRFMVIYCVWLSCSRSTIMFMSIVISGLMKYLSVVFMMCLEFIV